jgi:DNA gyrase subunit A
MREADSLVGGVGSDELAEVGNKFSTPRRTVLLEGSAESVAAAAVPLEVTDDPCVVLMSATGLVARVTVSDSDIYAERTLVPPSGDLSRAPHDVLATAVRTTARGTIGVVTSAGRLVKVNVLELPALPPGAGAASLAGGTAVGEFAALERGETVAGLCSVNGAGIAIGTAEGVVKRVLPEYPQNRDDFEVISLRPGDRVVGAVQLSEESAELVFITSDAQLLRFPASAVRPQGRAAGGMAGVRLSSGASVVWFGVAAPARCPARPGSASR